MKFLLLAVVWLQYSIMNSRAQDCLRANSEGGDSLPSFSNPGNAAPRINNSPIQAIITSYEFHCCGKIGGWAAFVEPGGGRHDDGAYTIIFQVWRPMSTDPNSYVKVGENSFPSVPLRDDSRIEEVPTNSEQLHFQPGDVIGYYLSNSVGTDGGLQFDSDFSQETLWYATANTDLQTECVIDVGTTGDLSMSTTLGPIISVSLTTTTGNCPGTFTSTMFCSAASPSTSPSASSPTLPPISTITPTSTSSQTLTQTLTPFSITLPDRRTITEKTKPFSTILAVTATDMLSTTQLPVIAETPTTDGLKTTVSLNPTDSNIPVGTENLEAGLIISIATPTLALVTLCSVVVVVILACVSYKKHKHHQESHYYDAMNPNTELTTMRNEAYGKIEQVATADHYDYTYVNPLNNPIIPTSQYAAYGDTPTSTSTNDDQDYCTSERLNDSEMTITQNACYSNLSQQSISTRATGLANDSSIPTTENEAYTNVSANTDGIDTEETYDYVRNL